MNKIYSYQKIITDLTTYQMNLPEGSTELCTLDGITYVSIPDSETLPEQPDEIVPPVEVTMTPELLSSIKKESPHARLIDSRMIDKIREKYTVDDELFFARIAGGAGLSMYEISPEEALELEDYKNYVESIREWGRSQRANLGLVLPTP